MINEQNISFENIRNDLFSYVNKNKGWSDFYNSSNGSIILDILSGVASFLAHQLILYNKEVYLSTSELTTSAIARANELGYSVNRGNNIQLELTVIFNTSINVNRFDIIGTYQQYLIVSLEDKQIIGGEPTKIKVVIGNIGETEHIYTNSTPTVARLFPVDVISQDYQLMLYRNNNEVPIILETSENMFEIINDKFVLITNSFYGVDIYYLNSPISKIKTGDKIRFYSNFTLPSYIYNLNTYSFNSSTDYYAIVTDNSNLIKIALTELDAYNNIPVTIIDNNEPDFYVNNFLSRLTGNTLNPDIEVENIFPRYFYRSNDSILLRYIILEEVVNFNINNCELNNGTIDYFESKILKEYQGIEDLSSIRTNAPLFFQTQGLVKSRKDIEKIVKNNTEIRLIDAKMKDISPNVVSVCCTLENSLFLNKISKQILLNKIQDFSLYGSFNPTIIDCDEFDISFDIKLSFLPNEIIGEYQKDIEFIIDNSVEDFSTTISNNVKKLNKTIDINYIEHRIINSIVNKNNKKYIKNARIEFKLKNYTLNAKYTLGDIIKINNGIYDYYFIAEKIIESNNINFYTDFANNRLLYTSTNHNIPINYHKIVKPFCLYTNKLLPSPLIDNSYYSSISQALSTLELKDNLYLKDIYYYDNGNFNIVNTATDFYLSIPQEVSSISSDFITINNHGFKENDIIVFITNTEQDLPTNVTSTNYYYVKRENDNSFKLKLSSSSTETLEIGNYISDYTNKTLSVFRYKVGYSDTVNPFSPSVLTHVSDNNNFLIKDNNILWKLIKIVPVGERISLLNLDYNQIYNRTTGENDFTIVQ